MGNSSEQEWGELREHRQHLRFVRQTRSGRPGQANCWLQDEPARQLINLKEIPVLIVTSEASYHAVYDHCTAAYLRQAGVDTTMIHLPDKGIGGNGHMMMLEANSDDIASVIHNWLTETLT